MSEKEIGVSTTLPVQLHDALRRVAKREHRSLAGLLRHLSEEAASKHGLYPAAMAGSAVQDGPR
jgi:hypothetical protein